MEASELRIGNYTLDHGHPEQYHMDLILIRPE